MSKKKPQEPGPGVHLAGQRCRPFGLIQSGNFLNCPIVAIAPGGDAALAPFVSSLWSRRGDRYSEQRGDEHAAKAEMSYLGG